MRAVKIIAAIAAAGYGALVALLYLFQDRFLFFPTHDVFTTPIERGLPYEELALVASDGVRLHGWWVPAPRARATVLYLHGNGGCIAHTVDAVETFARLGASVLAFDYRGYGKSEGTPSADGILRDAEAAWRHLVDERAIDPSTIVIVGRSLGGGPASALAARYAPAGLVLESTYSSIPDRAAEQMPFVPARRLVRIRFDNRANLAHVRCPVLVVHSRGDETIPFHHGERIFAAAREPKTFVEIAYGHNDGFARSGARYTDAIDRFIDQAVTTTR